MLLGGAERKTSGMTWVNQKMVQLVPVSLSEF